MPRILVIDDDSQVREMLEEMLNRVSYEVVAAENGRKGLDSLKDQPVDLAIVDMLMPDMDGLETIRRVRSEHPNIPIIALSGGGSFDRFDLLEKAKSLGAVASLRKPVDWEELTTVVGRLFGSGNDAKAAEA